MGKEDIKSNQEKKEYLNGYRDAIRAEKAIEEEIRQLRLDKIYPNTVQDGMPHGTGCSDLSGYAAKVDGLLEELRQQLDERIDIRREIVHKIEEMGDETEKLVLRYRYIHLLKWEEIAVQMDYSWRGIHKVHGRALKNFTL